MRVDLEAEVQARMADRVREAERRRLAAGARAGAPPSGSGRRLREAAGFGLVRTGLRLLDERRA